MQKLIIHGGKPLKGIINISGAKNAVLPIMAASILTDKLHITNVPKLTDVSTMKELLKSHGADIEIIEHENEFELVINTANINNLTADYEIVRKMRASIWVLGPLLSRYGKAKVSLPGGCAIGARQVDLHIAVLKAMGAEITIEDGYINASTAGRLKGTHFIFDKISVGATINAVLAAVLADGETLLFNCAREPEIVDLCNCLNKMGADISGIGTSEIRINGKDSLSEASYRVLPDRIEAGTYMFAAVITKGDLKLYGIDYHIIENIALKLIETGIKVMPIDNGVQVTYADKLNAVNLETNPYPGFATDLQAQFMSLMTISQGSSIITENIFENRFMHVPELCRMGADITVRGNQAIVQGVKSLKGAEVMASDLRASVSLILAGLSTNSETVLHRIYHLDRGFQNLEKKLNNCGADIKRV
ncbi:UDP-N-acetylglucosamine 1-carboxyvinyltransferase [Rickettsia sp. MEAM1 (Bemisia tabaci)]|uniref:UDP-N-acetylglucosamine 1-carboxyvinyltransferase n=1 Tax=unclassified Rickettsia TaxID=114295 RepID=UPI0008317257|nr:MULTISPECIES: UDP-N-acetylglucosamine 1-carboxyvinyltransferase [unclassified Rickettsia]ASX28473.1 UDP-N-acetylglucosamine 1-carboxyvinyltransferase [Rickettsia sp. MEAM1 (Bemisia tabaci)]ODA37119.1 UDP-N-acetylglucosamine 1-carboxyvinyltransferase [Rickettsia sp. wb]ODA38259.1 UDP-N-acetylglucosamine 1-carboxyvinyltransferase [Rickettsia sp. wq]